MSDCLQSGPPESRGKARMSLTSRVITEQSGDNPEIYFSQPILLRPCRCNSEPLGLWDGDGIMVTKRPGAHILPPHLSSFTQISSRLSKLRDFLS